MPGIRRNNQTTRRVLAAAALAPMLLLAACGNGGSDALSGDSGGDKGVVIGGQDFTEMQVMAAMYSEVLKDAGWSPTVKTVKTRDIYGPALMKGDVDVVPDYLSSMTEYLNKDVNGPDAAPVASSDVNATLAKLTELGKERGITPLEPAQAEDANGFAVSKEFAQANGGITTMSELAALGKPVTMAAAPDCPERSDCKLGLEQTYGLDIAKVEPLGFGALATKKAAQDGEVTLAQVGTSDGTLDQFGLVLLEDDKGLQNAENLTPVLNTKFLDAHPDIADVLNKLSKSLTTDDLKAMILKVDVDRELPEDVAKSYLQDKGLI